MDKLTFAAELIKAVVWPLTFAFFLYLIRKPLVELVSLIRKVKYQHLELEFDRELVAIKKQAAEGLPQPQEKDSLADLREKIMKLVGVSPEVAVVEAWRHLENRLHEYAQVVQIEFAPAVHAMPLVLAALLQKADKLSEAQFTTLTGLKQLRDTVTHSLGARVSVGEAIEYVDLVLWLMSTLK